MNNIYDDMRVWINKRASHVRVQTELGSAVKITKVEASKLIDILERRNVIPQFDCTEIKPLKYLVTIQSGSGGIYVDK